MGRRWLYRFEEGAAELLHLLGSKGAGIAELTQIGIPTPPGFVITTDACNAYYAAGRHLPEGLWEQVLEAVRGIEGRLGKRFGDPNRPLLLSVRSGAAVSMPGMMDTVLNLGLNDHVAAGIAHSLDPRFAYDAYRRLLQMFGRIVMKVPGEAFEEVLEAYKRRGPVLRQDTDLEAEELQEICERFKAIIRARAAQPFPQDPYEQLRQAITAVFDSWMGKRAVDYRRIHRIPDTLGTAVTVQAMVFGNLGPDSATGVAFTRNPATGEKRLYGEYLTQAQGEDVVAGIRTPKPLEHLQEEMPEAYAELVRIAERLERHYRDMQDIEFTIERGRLWVLQTRSGKRTGAGAIRIAVDMVQEGLIDRRAAVMRVEPELVAQLLHPTLDEAHRARAREEGRLLARGLPASPGAASGRVVFDPDEAERLSAQGERVILVRPETAPEDFHGMVAARAILTSRGGMTSHAAVVARGMGKPCVVGAEAITVDPTAQEMSAGGVRVRAGEWITVDGSTGEVYLGVLPTRDPELAGEFATFMGWADEFRRMGVRANADTPQDAQRARAFGAEGIGLCRTEHMFFTGDRIYAMREMIVATTPEERRAALARIEPLQRQDFVELFRIMDGFPVVIRTLDPPLHEFLPPDEDALRETAQRIGVSVEVLRGKVAALREANPMMGLRGCRLGILYPEITEMQARAIFEAAAACQAEGVRVEPEVMIPLVSGLNELRQQAEIVRQVAEEVQARTGQRIHYRIGTMVEVPRAALVADRIAEVAEFFSFGTNDLTQFTFGMSRDDAVRFLPRYLDQRILQEDPFQMLDREGVGQLVRMGTERGRLSRPELVVGICGEHGGEPASVKFCHRTGLDYVSCSPYRVPVARLAAAQAVLEESSGG
ncbi:pyruvate, phosphate dikinase [Candidatus Methylacidithermus pantelleriae]|uniref:Pyruvate, phosphate dikinase n=1 Tax=Candidatus Methylacidithermus pantelleriae TaxID=2744239 RepID=A0A8J2FXF4_9BACT|nr:pyruvate, phosphate dikinase [Candidatus Methylacidithermus pantelleriae]CAF0704994.1 Pyruvate, phosphate dikinase [Candidatus Methylacidithermus pantelleriae]